MINLLMIKIIFSCPRETTHSIHHLMLVGDFKLIVC